MNNTGLKFGGRKPGIKNKDLTDVRAKFQLLIENNIDALQSDLDCLKPLDRIKVIMDLAKFCIPTLKAIDFTDTNDKERISPVIIQFVDKDGTRDLLL